ncbi:MAG: amidohydrolase family protein [Anaerolineae bacterium]|nr:amidohydrolase family protein [Anaerolineae bacterium]
MAGISYFDCNVSIGRPKSGVYRPCPTAGELLAEMDWVGVDQALVHHALMRGQSPVVGNQVLVEEIAGEERLVGSWAILPPQTRELPQGEDFFTAMAQAGVRALWAFPMEHRYLLNRLTFGPFLDQVAERRIPLFIPRNAGGTDPVATWQLVSQLLAEYPKLTLVLAAHGPWGEDRYFRPLLERYPRFYLDISRYELDGGLGELVSLYGAERLLYGSNFPANAMGGPRMMLARAEISEEARRAIAGDNLRRLLQEVQL